MSTPTHAATEAARCLTILLSSHGLRWGIVDGVTPIALALDAFALAAVEEFRRRAVEACQKVSRECQEAAWEARGDLNFPLRETRESQSDGADLCVAVVSALSVSP